MAHRNRWFTYVYLLKMVDLSMAMLNNQRVSITGWNTFLSCFIIWNIPRNIKNIWELMQNNLTKTPGSVLTRFILGAHVGGIWYQWAGIYMRHTYNQYIYNIIYIYILYYYIYVYIYVHIFTHIYIYTFLVAPWLHIYFRESQNKLPIASNRSWEYAIRRSSFQAIMERCNAAMEAAISLIKSS